MVKQLNFLNYLIDCLVTFIQSLETPTLLRYFDKTNFVGLIELISIISIYIVFLFLTNWIAALFITIGIFLLFCAICIFIEWLIKKLRHK